MTGPSTEEVQQVPVSIESMTGALIDSSRITVATAMMLQPEPPKIILASEAADSVVDKPGLEECLGQAMNWLDAARAITVEQGAAVTSIHVVDKGRG